VATITAAAGGGNWSVGGTWVGGVVPTAADDVLLTGASGNVTIDTPAATCRSLDCTGYVGTLTIAGTNNLSIGNASGGSLKLSVGMTLAVGASGTFTFVSTSDNGGSGWSITTAGKALPAVAFNGVGGKWKLLDAFTLSGARTITFTAGHLDTNGMSVTASIFSSSGTGVRTLTLGASVLTLTGTSSSWLTTTSTNLTMTPNTATINLTGSNVNLSAGSLNFQGSSVVLSGSGTADLSAGFTVANLSRVGTAVRTDVLRFTGDATITGTFTVTGNSVTNRVLVSSNFFGTQRTVTAAVVAFTNVDFTDLAIAGAAAAAPVGVSVGDALGNSGITFTASTTQTYTGGTGNWSDATKWTSRVPLPQDDVIVGAAAAGTITADMPRLGRDINFTGFAGTYTQSAIAPAFYGSLILATGMTVGGTNTHTASGRGSHTITSAGRVVTFGLNIAAVGGTYTLADAFTTNRSSSSALTISSGTFDSASFAVTLTGAAGAVTVSSGATLVAGTSVWSFSFTATGSIWNIGTTGVAISAAAATFVLTVASANARTFEGRSFTYGTLRYTVPASTGALILVGASTFDTLDVQGGGRTLTLPASTVTTVNTLLRLAGTSAASVLTVNSSTGGTKANLSVPAVATRDVQFAAITDNDADGTAAPLTAYDSTLANTTDWLAVDRKSAADAANLSITAAVAASIVAAAADQANLAATEATAATVTAAAADAADVATDENRDLSVFADAVDDLALELDDVADLLASFASLDALDVSITGGGIALMTPSAVDGVDLELAEAALTEWLHSIGCMAVATRLVTRMTVTITFCEGPPMDEDPEEGSLVAIDVSITDEETGDPVDPTELRFVLEHPDGTEEESPIVHDGVGAFHVDVVLSAPGRWRWRWWSAGIGQASKSGRIDVRRATVNA
jgi:hypothetical protein